MVAAVVDPHWASTNNEYLEIVLGTGICGLIPVVFGLLGAWWLLVRGARTNGIYELRHQLAIEAIGVLAIVTTRTFFGMDMVWHPAQSFLLIVGYAELLRRERHALMLARQSESATPRGSAWVLTDRYPAT